jgi:hypothetical protein
VTISHTDPPFRTTPRRRKGAQRERGGDRFERRGTRFFKIQKALPGEIPIEEAVSLTGFTREKLLYHHRAGCWCLGGTKLWARKRLGTDAMGRLTPIWHFKKRQIDVVVLKKNYRDPDRPGWLSPRQVLEKYAIPYYTLWLAWGRGDVTTEAVEVPNKRGRKMVKYSLEADVKRLAAAFESPFKRDAAADIIRKALAGGRCHTTR